MVRKGREGVGIRVYSLKETSMLEELDSALIINVAVGVWLYKLIGLLAEFVVRGIVLIVDWMQRG